MAPEASEGQPDNAESHPVMTSAHFHTSDYSVVVTLRHRGIEPLEVIEVDGQQVYRYRESSDSCGSSRTVLTP